MAMSFDAAGGSGNTPAGPDPPSWTHTPVGDPTLIVGVAEVDTVDTDKVSDVTYDGVSMTNRLPGTGQLPSWM